jgi:hypothetical protein
VDNYTEFNGDIVAEFGLGGGYITGEAGAYIFGGDFKPYDNMFYGLVAYASPPVGPGRLQPMFRIQAAGAADGAGTQDLTKLDFQLGYLVKGAALRGLVGYSTTDYGGGSNYNMVQFGAQTIF